MAKTFKELKKTVGSSSNSIFKSSKDEKKAFKDIKVSNYDFSGIKKDLENTIRFDTLSNDLTSVSKTIGDTYGGWQTQETMLNTRSSVEGMKDRLRSLKEYQRLFGDKNSTKLDEISKIQDFVNSAVDNWDKQSELYGYYKNADAFNVAKKNAQLSEQFKGLSYDEVQEEKKKYSPDSDEYKFLHTYSSYNDLNDFDKALTPDEKAKELKNNITKLRGEKTNANGRSRGLATDIGGYNAKIKSAEDEYTKYLNSIGFDSAEDYDKYLNNLETGRNTRKLDHSFDLFKHYADKEDFAEKSKYVSTKGNYDGWWAKFTEGQYGMGYGDITYEYINNVDGIRDEIKTQEYVMNADNPYNRGMTTQEEKGYDKLNPEEVATYNYIYKTEGKDKAQEFLDTMEMTLTKRVYDEQTGKWKNAADSGGVFHSIMSIPASVIGAVPTLIDSISDMVQGKEYNPYSIEKYATNYASDVRKYVGENIAKSTEGMELFGQNIPSFLYSTGMSIADNLVGASTLGSAYLPLMSTNAFHQKAKEMTEAGEDTGTIYATALASGIAEMVFEKVSLDNFLKIKNVSGIRDIVKNTLKQAGIEGSEELATEFANIMSDSILRGSNSELNQFRESLAERGFTDKEINTEIAKKVGSQVGWATVGGMLSGGAMGGTGAIGNYAENSMQGADIRSKERVQDLIDLVGDESIGEAYETYNKFVGKGVNAENIKDAQLGRLYNEVESGAYEKIRGKNATDESTAQGLKTLGELGVIKTENALKKTAQENAKKYNVAEESNVDVKNVQINDGKVSIDTDATLTNKDANLLGYAEIIAKTHGDAIGNLFISQYDGKTELDKYHEDFNLAMTYSEKGFSFKHMVANKGSLSADDISNIYKETVIKAAHEKKAKFQKLAKEMGDKKFYKGFVDDSAIDYENKSTEGKINWKDLTSKQRDAVIFVKGFAQATGMNIQFVANHPKFNGRYDKDNNVVTLNLDNMESSVKGIKDAVIPAMSHETTHWMKEKSPELWTHLNGIVFNTLVDHYNSNTDLKRKRELLSKLGEQLTDEELSERTISEKDIVKAEMKRLIDRNTKQGKEIDEDALESEAREEIIARACEDLLKMSNEGRKIFKSLSASEQKTLFDKFKALVNDLIAWIDNVLNSYRSTSTEARIMRQYKEKLQNASKVWDAMLKESVKVNQALEKSGEYQNNASDEKNVRYDIREEYVNEIDTWEKDGMPEGETFILGTTGDVLQGLGAIESDIYMWGDKIKEILNDHPEMTIDEIKKIPQILENPVLILKSQNVKGNPKTNTRLVIFGNVKAQDGKPILSVLDLRPKENNFVVNDMQKVSSAYTKDSNPVDFVEKSLVVYVDKKRTTKLLKSIGFQMPIELQQSGYIGSISYFKRSVNINGEEFSKVFKKGQAVYSEKNLDDYADIETKINTSMTMDEAKQMIERAFVLGQIKEFYEGEYKNGDEWLRGEGASEVALYIKNEYTLTEKYLNKIQAYVDGDFYVEDILEAYLKDTLVGREKPKTKRLDLSQEHRINDKRFYSPQQIKNAKKLLSVAMQRVTNENRKEVSNARAKILLFAHNKGASELLGLSQADLNKKLRAWSNYSAKARDISKRFNNGVADSNKWTGIENCSWLYKSTIETKDLEKLVKSIKGAANDYEKMYVARTMLALDTHIDWSWLSFEFDTYNNVNKGKTFSVSKCLGYYTNESKKIVVTHDKPNTVAHEMGHALDYQWARDLGYNSTTLTEVSRLTERITDADEKQFFENFRIFIDSLTDNGDIRSEYTQDPKETFARFVARFVQWVDNTGTGSNNYNYETSFYNDKFTASNYIEFVKLLQEKAMLDSRKANIQNENVRFSEKGIDAEYIKAVEDGDTETVSRMVEEAAERVFSNSKVRGNDGKLRLVYHGRVSDFTVFDRQFANIEGDFGKGYYFTSNEYDVDENYANEEGPDLKNKISRYAEQLEWQDEYSGLSYEEREEIARQKFITSEPNTITAYLNMENPVYITPNEQGTFLDFNEGYDEETDEYGEPEGLLIDFVEALQDISKDYAYNDVDFRFIYEYAYDNGGVFASDIVKTIKHRITDELTDDNGDLAINEVIRLAFEQIGFDGIIDTSVYYKFRNMNGMDSGTTHYIVFDSSQIKSADLVTYDDEGNIIPLSQRFNTENEDIRYSDKDISLYDIVEEKDQYIKKLENDVANLKERVKLEKKLTNGSQFNPNHLSIVAGQLRKLSNSNMDKLELMKALRDVFTYIRTNMATEELTWQGVWDRAYPIAQKLVAESKPLIITNDYAKEVLRDIRNSSISLDETQKREARNVFDKHWNRNFFGKVKITDDAPNIDSKWQEWSSLYPDIFSEDTGSDKLTELYDIIESLKATSETIDEYAMDEKTKMLVYEIYNYYWSVSTIETTADKYNAKMKELESKHNQMMREIRKEYNESLEAQKLADDIYYGKKIQELKEKGDKKLQEQLKAQREKQREKQRELYRKFREKRNRDVAIAKQTVRDNYKESAERKTLLQSIIATATTLNKKLEKNDKDVHIPEALKPVVANLINAIDFSSKQLLGMKGSRTDMRGTPTKKDIEIDNKLAFAKSLTDGGVTLKQSMMDALKMFQDAEKVVNNTSDGTLDLSLASLDVDLIDRIDSLIKSLEILEKSEGTTFVLNKMSNEHLKTLNATVKSISHWANKVDQALSMKHKARISQLGEGTVADCEPLGQRQEYIETVEGFKNFFSWSNLLPVNAFKRLGEHAMKLFDSLRDAQDKIAFYKQEIMDFTAKLFKDHKLTHKDIKAWRTEIKEFTLNLPNGDAKTVKMPVSYVMTLYCLAKQEDAQRHLLGMDENGNRYEDNGGGMTIKPFKEGKLKVSSDVENTILTKALIKQITGTLTDKQRTIADELQKFLSSKGSEWCDEVSLALYGIKKFNIENYFPIAVSPTTIKVLNPQDKRQSIHFFSILNYGFTKSRNPNAKQSVEIGDIFDIFANHMSMAAIYSAYALPIYDTVRWFNYKGKTDNGKEYGVNQSIQKAFGKVATSYIGRLISDLNGQHESSRLGFVTKIFKNTKLAMVGNSISVALLQPTAYLKAMTKIPTRYLLKSLLYVRDFGARNGIRKSKEHCGIALWKSQGNFDNDISNSMQTQMLHDEKWHEKAKEKSLWLAGKMDELTWGVLWNACEFDVRANRKDLKVGSDEFYETIAYKLRDVIYETQVVDSPLTRSDIMRSPDNLAKMLTMFGSEMTVAYNMVAESFMDAKLYAKRNGKGSWKRNAKSIGMTMMAYTLTSAASQILNTMVQLMRDDEDKEPEEIMKMYFSNFLSDWLIFGKIPYVKEFLNYSQGYSASRPDTLWMDSSYKAFKYFVKAFDGKEGAGEKAIKESLKAMSYLSGLPMYNQYRDAIGILDTFNILEAEDFKAMIDDIFY